MITCNLSQDDDYHHFDTSSRPEVPKLGLVEDNIKNYLHFHSKSITVKRKQNKGSILYKSNRNCFFLSPGDPWSDQAKIAAVSVAENGTARRKSNFQWIS